jgi:DNA-binding response OmpR family regulator
MRILAIEDDPSVAKYIAKGMKEGSVAKFNDGQFSQWI